MNKLLTIFIIVMAIATTSALIISESNLKQGDAAIQEADRIINRR